MGKKSTKNVERPQSAQELRLLETQNAQLQAGIAVAQEQEKRSNAQYKEWQSAYAPMETGMIAPGATRENGYSDPSRIAAVDQRGLLFQSRQNEHMMNGGQGAYVARGGEAPVGGTPAGVAPVQEQQNVKGA